VKEVNEILKIGFEILIRVRLNFKSLSILIYIQIKLFDKV